MLKLFLKDDEFIIQAILGITIGMVLGSVIPTFTIKSELIAILLMTSINSIISIVKAKLESQFNDKIIFISFSINLITSILFLYLGEYIGLNLYYLALLALGLSIFKNLSNIRKLVIKNL